MHCRRHMFVPQKDQKQPTFKMSSNHINHGVKRHPWSILEHDNNRPRRPCKSAWKKNRKTSVSTKVLDLYGTLLHVKLQEFQVGTPSSPYSRNMWFQVMLAKRKNTCWGEKTVSISLPKYEDLVACNTRYGAWWFLSMCGECDDTCGVRRRLWSMPCLSMRA